MDYIEKNENDIRDTESIDDIISILTDDDQKTDSEPIPEEVEEIDPSIERQKGILSYLHDLVFGLVALLLILMLVFRVVVVSGPSMRETLESGDCLILLGNIFYGQPKQGDIIVASKDSFKDGEPIIKRVIATEGQVVDIDFINGIVYVDGVALDEPYTNTPTNLYEGVTFPLTVEKGCVFVLGDNRNDSKDSRSPVIGLIDCREILGKVLFIVFPGENAQTGEREFDRIGALW